MDKISKLLHIIFLLLNKEDYGFKPQLSNVSTLSKVVLKYNPEGMFYFQICYPNMILILILCFFSNMETIGERVEELFYILKIFKLVKGLQWLVIAKYMMWIRLVFLWWHPFPKSIKQFLSFILPVSSSLIYPVGCTVIELQELTNLVWN